MTENIPIFTEENAKEELKKGYAEAEKVLADESRLEKLFQKLEKKLKKVPLVGNSLSHAAAIASLVRSYVKKEYTDVPLGSIVAAISALLYFTSPVDAIPDIFPVIGHLDDAAVILVCFKLMETDINEYIKWRKDEGKELVF